MADEPQRHRIEVACPECGHTQIEPALVVSTQCRACRANFQVRDGKGVTRTHPVTRLAKPRKDTDPEPAPAVVAVKTQPLLKKESAQTPPRPFLMRLLHRQKPHAKCAASVAATPSAPSPKRSPANARSADAT